MAEVAESDAGDVATPASTTETTVKSDASACTVDEMGDNASENENIHSKNEASACPPAFAEANPFKMPVIALRPGQKRASLNVLAKAFTDKTEKTRTKVRTNDKPESENMTNLIKSDSANNHVKSTTDDTVQQFDSLNATDISPDAQNDNSTEKRPANRHSTLKYLSPAEQLKHTQIPVNYKEPPWGGIPDKPYLFEVLKSGAIVDSIDMQTKSFLIFGRLPTCDVTLEHPSLSRYHAVMQFCATAGPLYEVGWYLFDLDSTHGTWVNKMKVKPHVYQRIRVGHVVKFGGSTRLFILQGPDADEEQESELTVTEIKEQRQLQKREAELMRQTQQMEREESKKMAEDAAVGTQCCWGIDQDDSEVYSGDNPFALADAQNEDLYIADPKKALKGFFEREGLDLPEYNITDMGRGTYKCTVELPLDSPTTGEPVRAEVELSGKKKEVVVACALEACRVLDRHGELRKATHESRKKKKKNWEDEDFYDSDDDTFLDRTGDIEKKRRQRKKRLGVEVEKAQSYQTLLEKLHTVEAEISSTEERLRQAKAESEAIEAEEMDALDAFMNTIKAGCMDTKTKMTLKCTLVELRREQMRLKKLVNLTKPVMPALKKLPWKAEDEQREIAKTLPMTGKMKRLNKTPIVKRVIGPVGPRQSGGDGNVGEEEEEEEEAETEEGTKDEGRKDAQEVTGSSVKIEESSNVANLSTVEEVPKEASRQNDTAEESSSAAQPTDAKVKVKSETMEEPKVKVDCDTIQQAEEESTKDGNKKPEVPEMPQKPTLPKVKRKSSDTQKYGYMKKGKQGDLAKPYSSSDPDYVTWTPPEGQKGDGRTKLNEKYGY